MHGDQSEAAPPGPSLHPRKGVVLLFLSGDGGAHRGVQPLGPSRPCQEGDPTSVEPAARPRMTLQRHMGRL